MSKCPNCNLEKELKHKIFLPTEDQEDDHLICDDRSLLVCDQCVVSLKGEQK